MKDELTYIKGRIRRIKDLVYILDYGIDPGTRVDYAKQFDELYYLVDLRHPFPRKQKTK